MKYGRKERDYRATVVIPCLYYCIKYKWFSLIYFVIKLDFIYSSRCHSYIKSVEVHLYYKFKI